MTQQQPDPGSSKSRVDRLDEISRLIGAIEEAMPLIATDATTNELAELAMRMKDHLGAHPARPDFVQDLRRIRYLLIEGQENPILAILLSTPLEY